MSTKRNLVILFFTLALFGRLARAQESLDQQQTIGWGANTVNAYIHLAQTFTAGKSGYLSRVGLLLNQLTSGNLVVELQGVTSEGKPDGVVHASQSFPVSSIQGFPNFTQVAFSAPGLVILGQQYALVVYSNDTGEGDFFNNPWQFRNLPDSYAAGEAYYDQLNLNQGWTATFPGGLGKMDMAFQTYVDPERGFIDLAAKVDSLSAQLAQAQTQLNSCQQSDQFLNGEIVSLQTQLGQVQSQLTSCQQVNQTLTAQVASLQTQIAQLQSQLVSCQQTSQSLGSQLASATTQLNICQANLSQSETDLASLNVAYIQQTAQLNSCVQDKASLAQQLAQSQAKVAELQAFIATLPPGMFVRAPSK